MIVAAFWGASARAGGLEIEPVIGGVVMTCEDFRGVAVRTNFTSQLGDVARANYVSRMPIIFIDEERLATLPPKLQIFFYDHECGHHVLGHYFNHTLDSENDADCWAIQFGREHDLFTRADVAGFAPYFANSKGTPLGHLPGPERVARLLQCFDTKPVDKAAAE